MSVTAGIDLTPTQLAALRAALAPFAGRFDRVGVFGSRADGTALPGSDVDLVIYGADARSTDAIRMAIMESDLSIFADVVSFDAITDTRFAATIVRDAKVLFEPADFRSKLV